MKTFHIYKADCLGSSRVMLQSGWESGRSVFIHRARPGRQPASVPEMPYTLSSILRAMKNAKLGSPPCFVFHTQSALPLLVLAYLLRPFFCRRYPLFVYDIHDLNEKRTPYRSLAAKIRYGFLRHHVLAVLERFVLHLPGIQALTVSDGLSQTMVNWYDCHAPVVVQSAMAPSFDRDTLKAMRRHSKTLLFFGTPERLPVDLIDAIGEADFELHLYGRFGGREQLETQLNRAIPEYIRFFGEYSPNDLSFLCNYSYLLIFKPSDLCLNYKYSLPNKMFQALASGVSIILSENFQQMIEVLSPVSGAAAVLLRTSDLSDVIADLEKERTGYYWTAADELSKKLNEEARRRYLLCTQGEIGF